MVFGWRRAFCASGPIESDCGSIINVVTRDEHDPDSYDKGNGGILNLATPLLESDSSPNSSTIQGKSASVPVSPRLHCNTSISHSLFQWSSTPSSPRIPSTISILKSNLHFSKNRCGLCLQSVKRGRGVAIFMAECSHGFHFPCIAGHVKMKGSIAIACPVCGTEWKEMPILSVMEDDVEKKSKLKKQISLQPDLKVYNDDEPLASLTPKSRLNPIPESDESCDEDSIEFLGFHTDGCCNNAVDIHTDVDVRLSPEAAVISAGRSYETHAIVLRVKAPATMAKTQRRVPIDLVTVVDVSAKLSNQKLQIMKQTMRMIISSLSSSDRLSIVAFSSHSKRLLHLKRMKNTGKRTAYRIVEAMTAVEGASNAIDAVKKAAKVLEDRREKNTVASIILLSDVPNQSPYVTTTRYNHHQSHLNFSVHTLKLTTIDDHALANTIDNLLNVTVQDLKLQLQFVSGSSPAEIAAVYLHAPPSVAMESNTVLIGEMYANEEIELLIELKVPSPVVRAYRVLSVHCSYRGSGNQDVIFSNEHALVVPRPHTVRSSSLAIQRLRNRFITTRAIAESRRLAARNDRIGAYRMLALARAKVRQTSSDYGEFVVSIEAELNELQRRRQTCMEENCEPLTPTSAWQVAEKLAKVRKSLNRVGDLHGLENAGF